MEIGTAVRFLGRVKRIDALRDRVRVEDSKGHTVHVDSSLLVDIDIEINCLYTFVGEIVRKVIISPFFLFTFSHYHTKK